MNKINQLHQNKQQPQQQFNAIDQLETQMQSQINQNESKQTLNRLNDQNYQLFSPNKFDPNYISPPNEQLSDVRHRGHPFPDPPKFLNKWDEFAYYQPQNQSTIKNNVQQPEMGPQLKPKEPEILPNGRPKVYLDELGFNKRYDTTMNNTNTHHRVYKHYFPDDAKTDFRSRLNIVNPYDSAPQHERVNCWWKLEQGGEELGYVEFFLYDDLCPGACQHFRNLNRGILKNTQPERMGRALTYKGTYIHSIWAGYWLEGGDMLGKNKRHRKGGSMAGLIPIDMLGFMHYRHNREGLLSFCTDQEHFGSLFRITYSDEIPWSDGLQQIFGEVVKGWDLLKQIEHTPCSVKNFPMKPIKISDCGLCSL
jgi:cyclophilin family peptidyl-prolyl cis-trans isomerase